MACCLQTWSVGLSHVFSNGNITPFCLMSATNPSSPAAGYYERTTIGPSDLTEPDTTPPPLLPSTASLPRDTLYNLDHQTPTQRPLSCQPSAFLRQSSPIMQTPGSST
ncbi:unnamed protein product [Fusarium graminearum]|uniref:Chromosome 2, complete genome n=1 Tax=Gibberella zeae (strain ATCC MYA-4620 / CBS 123657 / FGSC 9075 / NRRL 31084 / PH-1) TaxID=229533 RepID=I1S981_GIBZE|nr:hypothetical protein FGSG_13411 [Fusarium graminearum PH-1]ESU15131.1 hypothetical protein FGSG_13411 [Fusarium graminearum PH-1]CEF76536.1 unnamed protein product [Fusarium graminearum]CZS79829.1 unnamed protein product [Fusarium graminearum]|eukprot:XP_011320556.1 hypothetical protein FGSG_13411 [Fusarium graminearum PH-1]